MATPKQRADQFSKDWQALEPAIIAKIQEYLKKYPVDQAVNKAFADLKIEEYLTKTVLDIAMVDVAVIAKEKQARTWFLNKVWPNEKFSLAQSISRASYKEAVKDTIKQQLQLNKTWVQTSKALTDKELIKGVLPDYINDVIAKGRKAGLSAKDLSLYRRAVRKAERNINRLAANGAPNTALKKAYRKILTATQTGEPKAIQNAIERGIRNKARYNAERIARTEIRRATTVVQQHTIDTDPDIIGWKSVLNSRHKIVDICDFYANADLYGMGQGVYPKDVTVHIPYHPNCFCLVKYIYRGNTAKQFNSKAGGDWLKKNPKLRKKMISKEDDKKFLNNPGQWKRYLRGWENLNTKMPRIPKEILK